MPAECELCGAPAEMEFNIVVPIPGTERSALIKGDICLNCYGRHLTDAALAVALFVRDMEKQKALVQPSQPKQPKKGL